MKIVPISKECHNSVKRHIILWAVVNVDLAKVSPFKLVIIGMLLTFVISDDKDIDELNVYGNFIVAVGSLLLTVAAHKELIKTRDEEKTKNIVIG